MKHIYRKGINEKTLLLLHGTGGDEKDLLAIGDLIDPTANILSVRGNVQENNYNRFFKRLAAGVFDLDDLLFRTKELNSFLDTASQSYGFARDKIIAIGYSNGANIAGSLLFHVQDALHGAILLRPMVPQRGIELPILSDKNIFISAGLYDTICPPSEARELAEILKKAQANVQIEWVNSGHSLIEAEFAIIKNWYELNF